MKIKSAIIAFVFCRLFSSVCFAADSWEANLNINIMNADNRLSFGQKADATDGIDGQYDVPAFPGGDLSSGFVLEGRLYWRDIMALPQSSMSQAGIKVWQLKIESPLLDKEVMLKWDPASFPQKSEAILKDTTSGLTVNMQTRTGYNYLNNGPRVFEIELSDVTK